ncbi:MAG: hypothetical protein KKD44_13525 [Proteobacteria bacterium]|nr:hypothetical protein [Pseudomonadota bacterium]
METFFILMMLTEKSKLPVGAVLILLFSLCLYSGSDAVAETGQTLSGFDHLFRLVTSDNVRFDPGQIKDILDYVGSNENQAEPLYQGGLDHAATAYCGFDVKADIERLTQYCFNPDIPSCAIMPSMIRLSSWRDIHGGVGTNLPPLWNRLAHITDPIVTRGVYYMQNTPDPNTGAYYGYDSYRTVILMKYKGQNALISILKQKDVSDVGKKGFILGDDKDLDYFYSGEKGLNMIGLSWVKSYLYDSFSVSVYLEDSSGEKNMKCGIFKWLKAGWAGKNMIRKGHIHKGLLRFSDVFKTVMESRDFPSPVQLADICRAYRSLPSAELKKKMEDHILSLQGKCTCISGCPKVLKSGGGDLEHYIDTMSPMEMSSALIVDYVKHILAKDGNSGTMAFHPSPDEATVF